MAAKEKRTSLLSLMEGGLWRMGIAIGVLVALAVGLFIAWGKWGAPAVASGRKVTKESIQCPPLPPWIKSDVVQQAIRQGSLDQLSIFDPQAAVQVARAFEMHPWVNRVTRVSKHPPATFVVELAYRKPVAMVVVPADGKTMLLPIDEDGIILPAADFLQLTEPQIRGYPRIHIPGSVRQGIAGDPWGDTRVTDAARIAGLLSDHWEAWNLYQIGCIEHASNQTGYMVASATYDGQNLVWGGKLFWGTAPGKEATGEPSAEIKVARLQQYIEQNGTLANLKPTDVLDLRSSDLTPGSPRTARIESGTGL